MPRLLHPSRQDGPIRRSLTDHRDESYSYDVSQNATISERSEHLGIDGGTWK
jgi:hypothetical protein